jgi:hypothetical protein
VEKVTVLSATIASGGSFVSVSVTSAACTVRMHEPPVGKSDVGSRVRDGPVPLTVSGWSVPPQARVNAPAAVSTDSEKVTVRAADSETPEAPSPGVVAVRLGASSGGGGVHAVPQATGVGAAVAKSALLLAVLAWLALRVIARVALGAGARPAPAKSEAVVP